MPVLLRSSYKNALGLVHERCNNNFCTATGGQAAVPAGRQVLVHGPAVGDEAQAQLEVAGQAAVGGQRQHQQRRDQEEAHHQQGHAAAVAQQVPAVGRRLVGPHLPGARTRGLGLIPV